MQAKNGNQSLMVVAGQNRNLPALTKEDIATLISAGLIPPGTPQPIVAMYSRFCRETGLSPFRRQVHIVKRSSKTKGETFTIQIGIDGYRAIADRTGQYCGNDDPIFDNETEPTKATVTVYKLIGKTRYAFTATARWSEYCPGDGPQSFLWNKMPHLMLGKVAESLALRKAFPNEFAGMTVEEMEEAESEVHTEPAQLSTTPVPENGPDLNKIGERETGLLLEMIGKAKDQNQLASFNESRQNCFTTGKVTEDQNSRISKALKERAKAIGLVEDAAAE